MILVHHNLLQNLSVVVKKFTCAVNVGIRIRVNVRCVIDILSTLNIHGVDLQLTPYLIPPIMDVIDTKRAYCIYCKEILTSNVFVCPVAHKLYVCCDCKSIYCALNKCPLCVEATKKAMDKRWHIDSYYLDDWDRYDY